MNSETPAQKRRSSRKAVIDFQTLPDEALLREREILPLLPFGSMTIWRRVKAKKFPEPVRLEGRITAWRWGAIRQWLEAQGQPEKGA